MRLLENAHEEALRVINVYEGTGNDLEFTVYVKDLEKYHKDVFDEIINELQNGDYEIKYTNMIGVG